MPDADLIAALHRKFYADIPAEQFAAQMTGKETTDAEEGTEETRNAEGDANERYADEGREEGLLTDGGEIPRPTHDDLDKAAVTGRDSLDLQEIAPHVKPVVKMTLAEARALKLDQQTAPTKVFWPDGKGSAYVIDKNAVQGIYGGTIAESVFQAKKDLRRGGDAESLLLGYPKRDGVEQTIDVAVTKEGDIVHNLNDMKAHAEAGNVAWAAEGEENEALEKAAQVSEAIRSAQV